MPLDDTNTNTNTTKHQFSLFQHLFFGAEKKKRGKEEEKISFLEIYYIYSQAKSSIQENQAGSNFNVSFSLVLSSLGLCRYTLFTFLTLIYRSRPFVSLFLLCRYFLLLLFPTPLSCPTSLNTILTHKQSINQSEILLLGE
jgi:hypothetical protein